MPTTELAKQTSLEGNVDANYRWTGILYADFEPQLELAMQHLRLIQAKVRLLGLSCV